MAIPIKAVREQVEAEALDLVKNLEAEIDAHIRKNPQACLNGTSFPLSKSLTQAASYELAKNYNRAGWVIVFESGHQGNDPTEWAVKITPKSEYGSQDEYRGR